MIESQNPMTQTAIEIHDLPGTNTICQSMAPIWCIVIYIFIYGLIACMQLHIYWKQFKIEFHVI